MLTKKLLQQGRGRDNLGRFVLRGKAQPVGVHTKQLSRQGRGRDNIGRLVLQGKAPSTCTQSNCRGRGGGEATSVGQPARSPVELTTATYFDVHLFCSLHYWGVST